MKRNFTSYLEDLDAKARKSVAKQQKVHNLEDAFNYGASAERNPINTDIGGDDKDGLDGVPRHANSECPSGQGEKAENALLEKIRQKITAINAVLAPRADTKEDARCPGLDSADDASLAAPSSPYLQRFVGKDTNSEDVVRALITATTGESLDGHGAGDSAKAGRRTDEEDATVRDDTDRIDWDRVPIAQATCCRWSEKAWTEEMERDGEGDVDAVSGRACR